MRRSLLAAVLAVAAVSSEVMEVESETAALEADTRDGAGVGVETADKDELKNELNEVEADNDTNEGIIEALLQKQDALKKEADGLRSKLSSQKGGGGVAALQQQADDLQRRAQATESAGDAQRRELAKARAEQARLRVEMSNSTSSAKSLRQKLSRQKLALLQSMQHSHDTLHAHVENVEEDGALVSGAQMQSQAGKLSDESDALNRQVHELSERLTGSQRRTRETHAAFLQAQADAVRLHREAEIGASSRTAFLHAFADAGVVLAKDFTEVQDVETSMPQEARPASATVPAATAQALAQLRAENTRLRQSGGQIMQKYQMLSKDYEKQREWIAALAIQQKTGRAAAAAQKYSGA